MNEFSKLALTLLCWIGLTMSASFKSLNVEQLEDRITPSALLYPLASAQPMPITQLPVQLPDSVASFVKTVEADFAAILSRVKDYEMGTGDIMPALSLSNVGPAARAANTAATMRHYYGFDQVALDGSGSTIVLVEAYADPNIQSDLDVYSATMGLPSTQVHVVSFADPNAPPTYTSLEWNLEESLDVEEAHALAPGATIDVVEAPDSKIASLFGAVRIAASLPGADVVSCSFGTLFELPTDPQYNGIFTTPPGHNPVAFVASAGDSGYWATGIPATLPNVISVGGTTASIGPGGSYGGETAWGLSGGKISIYESKPGYQANVHTTGDGQPLWNRGVPDVAYDADPESGVAVYDSTFPGQWRGVGGTSVGAPAWAAIIAIADEGRLLGHEPSLDTSTAMTLLYNTLQNGQYSSVFHDTTTGNNGADYNNVLNAAGPGYDTVTGLGTPNVPAVVDTLAQYHVARTGGPSLAANVFGLLGEDAAFLQDAARAPLGKVYVDRAFADLAIIEGNPFTHTAWGMAVQAWVASQLGRST